MPFINSILAGETLIRPSMKSEGFQAGVKGWQITRLGDAEFNSLLARGSFISGDGTGRHIEVNGITVPNGIGFFTGDPSEAIPGKVQPSISGAALQLDMQAPKVTGSGAIPYLHLATDGTPNGGVAEIGADSIALLGGSVYMSPAREIVTDEGWNPLTLAGTWAQNGAAVPRVRKDISGSVYVMGRVSGGASGLVTTLPAGYRPSQIVDIALKSNNDSSSMSWIQVNTTGTVNVVGNVPAAQVWLALNLSFSTK